MKKITAFLLSLTMFFSLYGCGDSPISEDSHITGVKNGCPYSYPDITYEEAFENFFADPTWKYFVGTQDGPDEDGDGMPDYTEDDVDIVEFTGYCTYYDTKVKALIQFTLDMENDTFEASYLSFNDVPQNMLTLVAVIEKAFEEQAASSDMD